MRVEAELTGTTATRVEVEDLTDDPELEPAEGVEVELEGYVSGFTAHPGTFTLVGETVQTLSSTEFRQGSSDDLRDDIRVEAEGVFSGGVLVVHELKYKRVRVKIEGDVTTATADTLTVMGLTVNRTSFTDGAWPGGAGRYKIEAFTDDTGSVLYADKIDGVGAGDDILQGPVQAETGAPTYDMNILGIQVDLSTASFASDDESPLTITEFFDSVAPAAGLAGTLIKVKGTFSAGTLTGDEGEIES
jgi:hypothetical protein